MCTALIVDVQVNTKDIQIVLPEFRQSIIQNGGIKKAKLQLIHIGKSSKLET